MFFSRTFPHWDSLRQKRKEEGFTGSNKNHIKGQRAKKKKNNNNNKCVKKQALMCDRGVDAKHHQLITSLPGSAAAADNERLGAPTDSLTHSQSFG